jgi:hypothetical protein
MREDLAPLSAAGHHPVNDQVLIIDIDDIMQTLDRTLRLYGEQPAYDNINQGNGIVAFLFDIYDQLGYLPDGNRFVTKNIREVLDAFTQYFDRTEMSSLERQCWYVAAQKLVDRFVEYKLYAQDGIHRYNFYNYHHGTLYLVRDLHA